MTSVTRAAERADWRMVDEGWGRRAVDFATLSEPANCREYVALHQQLRVGAGDRLLDVACGAGLAVELANLRGAMCAGVDASSRLIEVARDRTPTADLRVGDMHALPWGDATFDVVTSFRGIWGTTKEAMAEVNRVLVPGGRVGFTVWGHIKASPGAWALAPFRMASEPTVANQAAMVALGRPGAGEELLTRFGFVDVERIEVPFAWEFADPASYARALSSTGPAFEAIQAVGEDEFVRYATQIAAERVRDGLPLRAQIDVVGYSARRPARHRNSVTVDGGTAQQQPTDVGYLTAPPPAEGAQQLFDDDVEQHGFVMNATKVWAYQPAANMGLFHLLGQVAGSASLTYRHRAVLVAACASALGDSYCSLAWGDRLATEAGADVAGSVLRGNDEALDATDRALARWARRITRDPNATTPEDIASLRNAGFDDAQIFAITVFVGLRLAFSTVNDALGALPDQQLGDVVPPEVRNAVTYGRPVDASS